MRNSNGRMFLKGFRHGWNTALSKKPNPVDPLPPMPSVREWLESYGGTHMDRDTFGRCERDYYVLLSERKRLTGIYLSGVRVGSWAYVLSSLALLLLFGVLFWYDLQP